jgi:hypothetical protein
VKIPTQATRPVQISLCNRPPRVQVYRHAATVPLPFTHIPSTHDDWGDAAWCKGWLGARTRLRRVPIEWLIGVQGVVDSDFMTRPLTIPIRVCVIDGVYYVRDGHHRVCKARRLGRRTILAEVLVAS